MYRKSQNVLQKCSISSIQSIKTTNENCWFYSLHTILRCAKYSKIFKTVTQSSVWVFVLFASRSFIKIHIVSWVKSDSWNVKTQRLALFQYKILTICKVLRISLIASVNPRYLRADNYFSHFFSSAWPLNPIQAKSTISCLFFEQNAQTRYWKENSALGDVWHPTDQENKFRANQRKQPFGFNFNQDHATAACGFSNQHLG